MAWRAVPAASPHPRLLPGAGAQVESRYGRTIGETYELDRSCWPRYTSAKNQAALDTIRRNAPRSHAGKARRCDRARHAGHRLARFGVHGNESSSAEAAMFGGLDACCAIRKRRCCSMTSCHHRPLENPMARALCDLVPAHHRRQPNAESGSSIIRSRGRGGRFNTTSST